MIFSTSLLSAIPKIFLLPQKTYGNLLPSSSAKDITSRFFLGLPYVSSNCFIAKYPPTIPNWPSSLPPFTTVSTCEPVAIVSFPLSVPITFPYKLPISSNLTSIPNSSNFFCNSFCTSNQLSEYNSLLVPPKSSNPKEEIQLIISSISFNNLLISLSPFT